MKNLFILLLLLSSTGLYAQTSDTTKAVTTLPSITLKDINGKNVDFSSYGSNGKITIISFWATWCKPCIKELRNMNDLLEEWEEKYNVELVAVSLDDSRNSQQVKPFATGQGWSFDILLDPNQELQRAMNVTNPPVTFLVDSTGAIVYTHTGYLEGDEYELEEHIQAAAGVTNSGSGSGTGAADKKKKH
ncbi:MAG: redoxin domain-containing protein [Bacteroidetes bacterium]|nr:redoxin domain-containing protein [Bacteroidota bacterium]